MIKIKNYIVTESKEFGTYLRGDTVVINVNIKNTLTNAPSNPSSVKITIKNPAGTIVAGPTAMANIAVGNYDYDYLISASLTVYPFGIYDAVISTVTDSSTTLLNFVVFPWDILSRVRTLSGAENQSDMTDYHLGKLAWTAYEETLETIYEAHYNEKPLCDPITGDYIDGVNKIFQLANYPIADHNGDEQVTGYGQIAYGWDAEGYWIDSTGAKNVCVIGITDASYGIAQIVTIGGLAIPASARGIYVKYYTESPSFNKQLMREAAACLTAYKLAISFMSLGKATLADLQSNRGMLYERLLIRYEQIIDEIGFPNIGAGK